MGVDAAGAPVGRTTGLAKLCAGLAVVVLLIAGIFVLGRVADDDKVAMGLTAGWFGAVGAGGYLVTRARTGLRLSMGVGYVAVAVAAGVLIGLPTLTDDEVDEKVVMGTPAQAASSARPAGNVQLVSGSFSSIAHPGTGKAAVVELPNGDRKLTLTEFETDNGPDLRLYLSTGDPARGDLGDYEDLGGLKGNIGNQQYDVPMGLDLRRYSNVVVWCRAFSVGFTSAPLKRG